MVLEWRAVDTAASIGIALGHAHPSDAGAVLQEAHVAMYRAAAQGRLDATRLLQADPDKRLGGPGGGVAP